MILILPAAGKIKTIKFFSWDPAFIFHSQLVRQCFTWKYLVEKMFTTKFKFFKILWLNLLSRDFLGLSDIVFLKIKLTLH